MEITAPTQPFYSISPSPLPLSLSLSLSLSPSLFPSLSLSLSLFPSPSLSLINDPLPRSQFPLLSSPPQCNVPVLDMQLIGLKCHQNLTGRLPKPPSCIPPHSWPYCSPPISHLAGEDEAQPAPPTPPPALLCRFSTHMIQRLAGRCCKKFFFFSQPGITNSRKSTFHPLVFLWRRKKNFSYSNEGITFSWECSW